MRSIPFETAEGTELELHGEYDTGNNRVVGSDMHASVDSVKLERLEINWILWFKLDDNIVFNCNVADDDIRVVNYQLQTLETLDVTVADPLP
jgi:hypothetical protein